LSIRLHTDETHESVKDPTGALQPATSIEYSIGLDSNKTLPIMPYGTSRITNEIVKIDPTTMEGRTRFYPSFADYDGSTHAATGVSNKEVWLYDKQLEVGVDYTMTWNGRISLLGFEMQLNRASVLLISYDVGTYTCADASDPAAVRTALALHGDLDVDGLLPTTQLVKPLVFKGTNDRGKLELPYYPKVAKEVVESDGDDDSPWDRPDRLEGVWYSRRTAGTQCVDGKWYGSAVGYVCSANLDIMDGNMGNFLIGQWLMTLAIQAVDVEGAPTVNPVAVGFPDGVHSKGPFFLSDPYEVAVGTAMMTCYTVVDQPGGGGSGGLVLPILGMGLDNSDVYDAQNDYLPLKQVTFNGLPHYEPILVHVEGNKAKNITDYYSGQNPGFARTAQSELEYQYIHVGRKLYFNRPLKDTEIRVLFSHKAAYVQLIATMRNTPMGMSRVTPVLRSFKLAMQTARR
jgi:hypothetical protein